MVNTSGQLQNRTARERLPLALAALLGLGFAWLRLGLDVLNPLDITWFKGDSIWHFLVWNFFRSEPWHLQPGRIIHMMVHLGSSIGSGDAVPLLAFPFKLLSPVLPAHFQYLGAWLYINYALQAVFGYLLAHVFVKNRWLALLLGLFFLVSPVMIFRAGHIALSAHWLILMALWRYFDASHAPTFSLRAYTKGWLLCVGLAGLVHPYLTAMVFPIAFASLARETIHSKRLKWYQALALLASLAVLLIFEWWLSGLIGSNQNLRSWGFNYFTMNLLAPFNPEGHSRLLPSLPVQEGQYEGYAFLGTGILALGLLAIVCLFRAPRRLTFGGFRHLFRHGHPLLFVFALLYFGYAIGDGLTLGNLRVENYSVFKNFPDLISTFRAPGRFFWPVIYLIYLSLFVFILRTFSARVATMLLVLAFALQLGDLSFNTPFISGQTTYRGNLKSEHWPALFQSFSRIVVTPAFDRDLAGPEDFVDFSYLASSYGTELTTGAVARPDINQVNTRLALQQQALRGPRGTDALYVFSAVNFAARLYKDFEPGMHCYPLDAYLVCHNSDRELGLGEPVDPLTFVPQGYDRFSTTEFLEHYRRQTTVIAVNGAPGRFSLGLKQYLSRLGSKLGTIGVLQGSYVGVIRQGDLIFESISDNDGVTESWPKGATLGEGPDAFTVPKGLYTYSYGIPGRSLATIATDDVRHKAETPGFSMVVLDKRFKLLRAADFNTFVSDTEVLER